MIVYGKQIFLYIINHHQDIINEILLSKDIERQLFNKIKKLNKPIKKIDNKKAQALSKNSNHQGYFLDIKQYNFFDLIDILDKKFVVILDNITDMGNIGSIIRTAYSLGVDAIIISNIKHIKIQNIIRTSSGAAFDLAIVNFYDINDLINRLKQNNFRLIGADINGKDLKTFQKDDRKIALFMGNEANGLSKKIKNKLENYTIQMKNNFDSLNVSVATSIFIYELI